MEKNFFRDFLKNAEKIFDNIANRADTIVLTVLKILAIFIVAKLLIWVTKKMTRAYINRKKKKEPDSLISKKSETAAIVIQSVLRYTIYFFMIAFILSQLDDKFSLGSILATAGIGGIALGLGAQALIKDVFSGFFLLFENQFAVGDFIEIREKQGTVEAITLRTTSIRVWTGEVVIIPNGTIDQVINYTRGDMLALVTIYIAHNEDIPKALEIMEQRCMEYSKDHADVVEKPMIQGVIDIAEKGIELRAIVKTLPMSQWKTERALKLDIYQAFEAEGIEIPYPKRVVIDPKK